MNAKQSRNLPAFAVMLTGLPLWLFLPYFFELFASHRVLVDSPAFIMRSQAFDYTPRRPVPVFHPYSLDQVRRSIHRPAQVF